MHQNSKSTSSNSLSLSSLAVCPKLKMSDGSLTVLDGTHLGAIDFSLPLPVSDVALTGAQVLDIADSTVSSSLFGLSLPQNLKSSALRRINIPDADVFRSSELSPERASETIKLYITAIADQLKGICTHCAHIYIIMYISMTFMCL